MNTTNVPPPHHTASASLNHCSIGRSTFYIPLDGCSYMLLGNIIATGGLLLFLCLHNSVAAFSHQPQRRQNAHQIQKSTRRSFLGTTATILVVANLPANAVVMDSSQSKVGTVKSLTPEEAEERFRAGRKTVDYLLKNYDEICDGGGDNVRRYLGTVGIASGLFGISKAMKTLSERADDIVECEWRVP